MAKRTAASAIWRDGWFRKLPASYKLAYRFLADEADHRGVVEIDVELWQFLLGYNPPLNWESFFKAIEDQTKRISPTEIWLPLVVSERCGALTWDCPAHRTVLDFLQREDLLGDPRIKVLKIDGTGSPAKAKPTKTKGVKATPPLLPGVEAIEPIKKPRKTREAFVAPTLEEVEAYCRQRGNDVNPTKFFAHYAANGWVQTKGKPIVDWKMAVVKWESDSKVTDPVAKSEDILKSVAEDEARRKTPERHGKGLLGE